MAACTPSSFAVCEFTIGDVAPIDLPGDLVADVSAVLGSNDGMEFRWAVRNQGQEGARVEFNSSPRSEFWAYRGETIAWRATATPQEVFWESSLLSVLLEPSEEHVESVVWDYTDCAGNRVPHGPYEIVGALILSDETNQPGGYFAPPIDIVVPEV